jgi:hypothetical protein
LAGFSQPHFSTRAVNNLGRLSLSHAGFINTLTAREKVSADFIETTFFASPQTVRWHSRCLRVAVIVKPDPH